jgi:hypothetical protein
MHTFHRLLPPLVSLLAVSLLVGACGSRTQARQPEYTPTATVKDLMEAIVDPSADVVWESVQTVVSADGINDAAPHTPEEWAGVRLGALRLAEASNLLMVPGRHVARPGEKSVAPGVELEPEEIETLVNNDRETWNKLSHGLHDASLAALQAIEKKDVETLFNVGEQIERACENCHSHYWYPNEKIPPVPSVPSERSSGER